ncbi:major facilitator transporter [Caballeronia hypogeia]|uniref:Major facilitator transporter n=1 Tax=Caballeronia hypogeia TaxID=1777140 RepID=A0A158DBR1_9BURK|nr:MFS transporter [Caballeronia hypogeia]SAK91941.1 major facilitator transporter [Caballeronia hypogeia]
MSKNLQISRAEELALDQAKPSRQRVLLLFILFIGISVAYLDRVNVAVIAANAQFLADMGIAGQPVKIGLLMSSFLIAYGTANVILSPLGAYLGPRKAMISAYLIICAALVIGGIAGTFAILIATRIMLGIGEGLYYPMQNTFVKNWFPSKERGRANTAWIIGQSLAPAVAMPIFTYLVMTYSWRATFHWSFALSLIPLALLLFFTADTPRRHKRVNQRELEHIEAELACQSIDRNGHRTGKESLRELAGSYVLNYRFWLLMLILATNSILSWGLLSWLPTYLNHERGFSWETMGWMSSLPFIVGLFFKIISGILIDRTGRNAPIIVVSALLCAVGVYSGVVIENNYVAAITIAFGIGASSMQIPAIFTLLQALVPKRAISSAAGTLNGIAVGFGALSPVLIGFSISITGNFSTALYVIIGVILTGGLLAAILATQRL